MHCSNVIGLHRLQTLLLQAALLRRREKKSLRNGQPPPVLVPRCFGLTRTDAHARKADYLGGGHLFAGKRAEADRAHAVHGTRTPGRVPPLGFAANPLFRVPRTRSVFRHAVPARPRCRQLSVYHTPAFASQQKAFPERPRVSRFFSLLSSSKLQTREGACVVETCCIV